MCVRGIFASIFGFQIPHSIFFLKSADEHVKNVCLISSANGIFVN